MVKKTAISRDRDTEQRILDAAHAVFLRRGTAGARTQEIAEEAGVNKALLHYYFRSKERLAEAVFQQVARQLLPPVMGVLASDLELEEKVARVVALELDVLSASPFLPGYVISELNHHPERARQLITSVVGDPDELRPRVFAALGQQIDARVKAGTMRRIAPEQFVVNLLALCIFPFAVRPMVKAMLGLDEAGFQEFIKRRREDVVTYVLASLRP
jgi:AcrR family transcriptional regulator